jgi:IS30 family transposase
MGRLVLDKKIKINTETAYRFVLQDKAIGGALYKYLHHQHKKYRKRYSKNDYRGRIPNRMLACLWRDSLFCQYCEIIL